MRLLPASTGVSLAVATRRTRPCTVCHIHRWLAPRHTADLKYTCNASFSWGRHGSGNHVSLPATGPLPRPAPLRMASGVRFRYAYNVCTFGYSMAFWNFTSFEAELDRLALWGVNLPLAFQGQEYTAGKARVQPLRLRWKLDAQTIHRPVPSTATALLHVSLRRTLLSLDRTE